MAPDPATLLEVGHITKAHGLRGDVLVTLTTTESSRVDPGSVLYAGARALRVEASQAHQHRWIVTFAGVDSREDAEALQGSVLRAEPLGDDDDDEALWVHDLIGATVIDADGITRGQVTTVLENPASDLLELDTGFLVPLRFVVGGIDTSGDGRVVRVDPPAGLFDPL